MGPSSDRIKVFVLISEAINKMAEEYKQELLEPELRPEYIEKLGKIEKEKTVKVKDIDEYFEKLCKKKAAK
ncbi:MAG: antitoxin [archaeon]